jgi:hypothetical protein
MRILSHETIFQQSWNKGADFTLYEMGIKEKEHEVYFLEKIKSNKLLAFFETFFNWGKKGSFNNVDLDKKYPVED